MNYSVPLHQIAITRSGDKGDISNIGIIAFTSDLYQLLKNKITPEMIRDYFSGVVHGKIEIFPMDNIESLQIVMENALGGGATKTLRFDQTGKSMASLAQLMEVPFTDEEMKLIPSKAPFEA